MLTWEIKNRVIHKLYWKGNNIISPWGFETADSSAFFSLEKNYGYRYEIISEEYEAYPEFYKGNLIIQMKEGKWELNFEDTIEKGNLVRRKATIKCLEDSYFMDFVLRFQIKKKLIEYSIIENKIIYHKDTNFYHQYPVKEVYLKGESEEFKISIINSDVPNGMIPMMYVRDREDVWIVHVRMLPTRYDKIVIKLCNNWFKTKPIPQFLSKIILLNKKVKQKLWYRGEKSRFKSKLWRFINPAAFPMVKLEKGTTLSWETEFKIISLP
jgi:hypothetical protein